MGRSKSEANSGGGEPLNGIPQRPAPFLQDALSRLYRAPHETRLVVRGEGSARFSQGEIGGARDATYGEIVRAMNGGGLSDQSPMDRDWDALKEQREARRDAAKALRRGQRSG